MKKITIICLVLFLLAALSFAEPKDDLSKLITSEYSGCVTLAIFAGAIPIPVVFKVAEIESLAIENGILTIQTKNVKDKSKLYRKAIDKLSLVWIKKDKKKGETKMTIAFAGKQKASDTSVALGKTLVKEYENCNNIVTLIGFIKLPIIINKTNSKVETFAINNNVLNIVFSDDKKSVRIYAAATGITQVSVKKDHKKSLINLLGINEN